MTRPISHAFCSRSITRSYTVTVTTPPLGISHSGIRISRIYSSWKLIFCLYFLVRTNCKSITYQQCYRWFVFGPSGVTKRERTDRPGRGDTIQGWHTNESLIFLVWIYKEHWTTEAPAPYIQEGHVPPPLLRVEGARGAQGWRNCKRPVANWQFKRDCCGCSRLLFLSFSALRRSKTHIRSTIGQPRLNHLLFLHWDKDRLGQVVLRSVAQEFVSANDKRSKFFGNYI